MNTTTLKDHIKDVDIYILDQILKDRYQPGSNILDVGCGNGRNLKWFNQPAYEIFGSDLNEERVRTCQELYSNFSANFIQANLEETSYESNFFDHVICIAVLHFAKDEQQFFNMFDELIRILKPQGSLLIRTGAVFGIENELKDLGNGRFKFPDGSPRFLLNDNIVDSIQNRKDIKMLENVKTTIVRNKRAMTTLVLQKLS